MKTLATLISILLLTAAASADTVNVALNQPVTLNYAKNDPRYISMHSTAWNPALIVDGLYSGSSFFELVAGQTGTSITVALLDTCDVVGIVEETYPRSAGNFRLRGYRFEGSLDGASWVPLAADSANPNTTVRLSFSPSVRLKFVRLTVTHMDPTLANPSSTTISELQVMALITKPTVIRPSLASTSSMGTEYQDILWSSVGMTPGSRVNISSKRLNDPGPFNPLAYGAPNTGRWAWRTNGVPDGTWLIRIEPDTTDAGIATFAGNVQNFTGMRARILRNDGDTIGFRVLPLSYAAFRGDSILLDWKFIPKALLNFSYRFSCSIDSGSTWTPFFTLADSSKRTARMAIPAPPSFGLYSFFGVSIMNADTELAFVRSTFPVALNATPPGLRLRWLRSWPYVASNYPDGQLAFYVHPGAPPERRLIAAMGYQLTTSGESVPGWSAFPFPSGRTAVSDLEGNGVPSIISSSYKKTVVISNDSLPFTPSVMCEAPSNGMSISAFDMDGDGKKEILTSTASGLRIFGRNGVTLNGYPTGTSGVTPTAVDLDGDAIREVVFTDGFQLKAVKSNGLAAPGFPVTTSDKLNAWVLQVDFDRSGKPDLVVASDYRIFCFRQDGTLRSGFPYFSNRLASSGWPAAGDIDGDGFPDIVIAALSGTVYAVDRNGRPLEGWPVELSPSFYYPGSSSYFPWDEIRNFPLGGGTPFLLSIDGDDTMEVVLHRGYGFLAALDRRGKPKPGFPLYCESGFDMPLFGDLDGNGSLGLVLRSIRETGVVQQLDLLCLNFGQGSYNPARIPWPMFMQNSERTGIAPQSGPQHAVTGMEKTDNNQPVSFGLEQNYPNPFNASTNIQIQNPKFQILNVRVFDLLGREVATLIDRPLDAGTHRVTFDGSNLAAGIYYYTLSAGGLRATKSMILLK